MKAMLIGKTFWQIMDEVFSPIITDNRVDYIRRFSGGFQAAIPWKTSDTKNTLPSCSYMDKRLWR